MMTEQNNPEVLTTETQALPEGNSPRDGESPVKQRRRAKKDLTGVSGKSNETPKEFGETNPMETLEKIFSWLDVNKEKEYVRDFMAKHSLSIVKTVMSEEEARRAAIASTAGAQNAKFGEHVACPTKLKAFNENVFLVVDVKGTSRMRNLQTMRITFNKKEQGFYNPVIYYEFNPVPVPQLGGNLTGCNNITSSRVNMNYNFAGKFTKSVILETISLYNGSYGHYDRIILLQPDNWDELLKVVYRQKTNMADIVARMAR